MKINKKEVYSIDDLSKEELLFFLEVVEKIQLSPDSSPLSFQLAEKFKDFRADLLGEQDEASKQIEEVKAPECDGCSVAVSELRICPTSNDPTPLCESCWEARRRWQNQLHPDKS